MFKPTKAWMQDFVHESNLIDPQPGFENEPGSARFDDHMKALETVIAYGNAGDIIAPKAVHKMLMGTMWPEIAGELRKVWVSVSAQNCPPPEAIPDLLSKWNEIVERVLSKRDAITDLDGDTTYEKYDKNLVLKLHVQFEKIHPFRDGNGRSGRLLMVNHAIILGIEPWVTEYDTRFDYYDLFL